VTSASRPGARQEVAQLGRAGAGADPHHHQAGLLRGQEHRVHRRPVREDHPQAVTGLEAGLGEHGGQLRRALVIARPGEDAGRVVVDDDVGGGVRTTRRMARHDVAQGLGAPPPRGHIGVDECLIEHRIPHGAPEAYKAKPPSPLVEPQELGGDPVVRGNVGPAW
jgi:hypothetical protein